MELHQAGQGFGAYCIWGNTEGCRVVQFSDEKALGGILFLFFTKE